MIHLLLSLALLLLGMHGNVWSQIDTESALASINALPPEERQEALVAAARKEGLIEWYGSLLVNEVTDLIDAFKQRYPFIEVKYTRGGGTNLVSRVLTEQKAGTQKFPPVFWTGSLGWGFEGDIVQKRRCVTVGAKRKRHTEEFKAKVALEAIRGVPHVE
jgi:hypothetical protein